MARRQLLYVDGISEIFDFFESSGIEAIEAIEKASDRSSDIILSKSKRYCPVLTGDLKRSLDKRKVKSRKTDRKFYDVYSKGKRKGGVRYGFAVEAGTNDTKAQPFLRPATDQSIREINNIFSEEIGNAINRANRGI